MNRLRGGFRAAPRLLAAPRTAWAFLVNALLAAAGRFEPLIWLVAAAVALGLFVFRTTRGKAEPKETQP